jgi:hypothetical protein
VHTVLSSTCSIHAWCIERKMIITNLREEGRGGRRRKGRGEAKKGEGGGEERGGGRRKKGRGE